jgi:hypothetical protein
MSDPDTVGALHIGTAQGFADTIDDTEVDELVSTDPRRARWNGHSAVS